MWCCAGGIGRCQWACMGGSCPPRTRHASSVAQASAAAHRLRAYITASSALLQGSGAGPLRQPYDFAPRASLSQRPLLASSFYEPSRLVPYTELPIWASRALSAATAAWTAVKDSPAQMSATPLDTSIVKVCCLAFAVCSLPSVAGASWPYWAWQLVGLSGPASACVGPLEVNSHDCLFVH